MAAKDKLGVGGTFFTDGCEVSRSIPQPSTSVRSEQLRGGQRAVASRRGNPSSTSHSLQPSEREGSVGPRSWGTFHKQHNANITLVPLRTMPQWRISHKHQLNSNDVSAFALIFPWCQWPLNAIYIQNVFTFSLQKILPWTLPKSSINSMDMEIAGVRDVALFQRRKLSLLCVNFLSMFSLLVLSSLENMDLPSEIW